MLRAYQKGLLAPRWDAPCLEKRLLQDAGRKPAVVAGQHSVERMISDRSHWTQGPGGLRSVRAWARGSVCAPPSISRGLPGTRRSPSSVADKTQLSHPKRASAVLGVSTQLGLLPWCAPLRHPGTGMLYYIIITY